VQEYSFHIGDIRNFTEYISGGIVKKVKKITEVSFNDLKSTLREFDANTHHSLLNINKKESTATLHMALNGILAFHDRFGRLPVHHSLEDSNKLKSLVKEHIKSL
jgi:hypothetical protein